MNITVKIASSELLVIDSGNLINLGNILGDEKLINIVSIGGNKAPGFINNMWSLGHVVQYLECFEKHGEPLDLYLDNHNGAATIDNFTSSYRGYNLDLKVELDFFLENYSLPSIILDNLDLEGIAWELGYYEIEGHWYNDSK
jgi:hypothetical protein